MRKKKRPLTLLEIMIVIFLIGLIGSVIGYNMKGSLDEGKAFKTKQGSEQIRDILLLEIGKGKSRDAVIANYEDCLKRSGLVKDVKTLCKDGWNEKYEILPVGSSGVRVFSKRLANYEQNKKKGSKVEELEEEQDLDQDEE